MIARGLADAAVFETPWYIILRYWLAQSHTSDIGLKS